MPGRRRRRRLCFQKLPLPRLPHLSSWGVFELNRMLLWSVLVLIIPILTTQTVLTSTRKSSGIHTQRSTVVLEMDASK